jgi:hypothetical protein
MEVQKAHKSFEREEVRQQISGILASRIIDLDDATASSVHGTSIRD